MYTPKNYGIIVTLLLWRVSSVFLVQTAHVPDEYWQSLEVAHQLAFGYGYLTWEWTLKIRSYIYPVILSFVYQLLAILNLDDVTNLIVVPRLLHAIFTAYGDYRFYKWTKNKWMLLCLCVNWYWYYCATRTIVNSIETTCTIIALSMFPWQSHSYIGTKFLWIVGFLTMIRPTAAIVWIPLCLYNFYIYKGNKFAFVVSYTAIFSCCFLFSVLLDSYCYREFTISPWEFFKLNVLQRIGNSYGQMHLYWYLTSGLPVVLGINYCFLLIAVYKIIYHPACFHQEKIMLIVIGWTLFVYSLLSHKEFRFLLPLVPMLVYVSVSCTSNLMTYRKVVQKSFITLFLLTNIIPGLYFSLIHQRGTLDVMSVLKKELIYSNSTSTNVLFLTPCHATPLYSHLHVNIPIQFLTCEPNLNKTANYMDETDRFFAEPMHWLNNNFHSDKVSSMPSHIVLFDSLVPKISAFLKNYKPTAKLFHTHFPATNYGEYILVYKHIMLDKV